MAKDKLLLEKIKKQINKAKVVSFDIFDTLLVRPYVRPVDLFEHMEKAYERPGFAAERKDAERRTRIRHKELEDVTFDMIYDEIDEEFKDMKQKEMDWEEMVLRANPELKQVYDYALAQGKRVIITSDMYLPTAFLAKVLRKNGYDKWDKLYVSGDVGKRKGTGALFEHLLEDNNVSPKDVLHIGDNEKSDYNTPNTLKIKSVLYLSIINQFRQIDVRNKAFIKQMSNNLGGLILISVLAYQWQQKRCRLKKVNDYWSEIGYQYAGPLAYGYTRFLEREAQKRDINHLIFVARDGYTLQKVFKVFNQTLKNTYVYANGALRRITSLECKNNGVFGKYIVDYYSLLSPEIKEKQEQFTFRTADDYERFINVNYELFEPLHNKFRANYQNYLNKIVDKNDRLLVIDTMARTFASLALITDFLKNPILGAYFTFIKEPFSKYFNFCSYAQTVYGNDVKWEKNNINLFTKNWDFMEFLLSSPEQPIKQIDANGQPVYEETDNFYKLRRAKIYPMISDGAVSFAQNIQQWFNGYDIFITFDTVIKWINIFMDAPSKDDIKNMSTIRFFQGVGDDNCEPLFCEKTSLFNMLFHYKSYKKKINILKWKSPLQTLILNGIIQKTKSKNHKSIKFLGIPYYKKVISNNETTKTLFGIIQTIQNQKRKKIYFMGMQLFSKKSPKEIRICEEDLRRIIDSISLKTKRMLTTSILHQKTFGEFRNVNQNKECVLIGAGPSVKYFNPIKGAVYIGVNRAFLLPNVHFSYLFTIDKAGLDTGKELFYDGFFSYDCIKFVGDQNLGENYQIPQSKGAGNPTVRRYKTTAKFLPNNFSLDIDTEPLGNSASSSLQAMQFILYTNPKRIYIVGIDCTSASMQHFIGSAFDNSKRHENIQNNDIKNIQDWKRIKGFINTYYPETEVIVINPVGLRGIFRDVYTRSYLRKHPEIDSDSVEILEEEEIKK